MNIEDDTKLRTVLGVWQVEPPPAPDFKAAVWRRIAEEEQRASRGFWARVRDFVFVTLPTPAYATAVLALTIGLSAGAAGLRARHSREEHRLNQARQYLASIDPMAMAARSGPTMR